MNRLKKQFLTGGLMLLLIGGCVTRTTRTAQITPQASPPPKTVKPSSLSDYIRGVYKLSAEASQQLEQRSALLADAPELEDLIKYLQQNPEDSEARSRLVAEYMSRKLYWGAYEALTNGLPGNLNDPETNLNLADIWDAWGQYDLAWQFAEHAIANGAGSAHAYEIAGRIELHRQHPTEALVWYSRSLEGARTAPVLANVGFAQMLKSEWESAKASLEEATQLDDTLAEAHNNLAIVLSKTGDQNAALTHLLRAARPAVAFNNMGVLYLQSKQLRDAQKYFEKALTLEPDYEVARRNLTEVEALLPALPVESAVVSNSDSAPPAEEIHVEEQPQAAEENTANLSRDESDRVLEAGQNSHVTGVKQ